MSQRRGFSQTEQELYQLAVEVRDGGEPALSSISTLTLRVCPCQRGGRLRACQAQAFLSSAGLSTGALIAILLCIVILLGKSKREGGRESGREWEREREREGRGRERERVVEGGRKGEVEGNERERVVEGEREGEREKEGDGGIEGGR